MNAQADDVMAALPPVKYNITDAALADLKTRLAGIDARENYDLARDALKECTSLRTSLEERRKFLKKDALEYGRKVDSEAKRILAKILEVEDPIKATKQAVDAEQERLEALRRNAVEAEFNKVVDYSAFLYSRNLGDLEQALASLQACELDENALQERFHDAVHMRDELLLKLRDQLAAVQREADERAKLEQERKRQAEEQARIDAENRKIEEKRAAQQREDERIEREKRELAEAKERQAREEQAAKERAEREERERAAREKAEREERERQEAMRPDKDKLLRLADDFANFKLPKLKTDEGQQVVARIATALLTISNMIKDELQ